MSIMSNRVANLTARIAFIILLVLVIGASAVGFVGSSRAQERPVRNMRTLLEKLDKDKRGFTIVFIKQPLSPEVWWTIPKDFKDEKGNLTGRRLVREIGDDYICINDAGQGEVFVTCVPFSNIASIEFDTDSTISNERTRRRPEN
jgi:hypothetical protein